MAPPSLIAHLDASKDSTALSLAYASIGDEGCNAIARFMRENVMLKTMDLRGNNVRADGLVVLAHALRSCTNIVSICLKWNHVGSHERGVRALCDVLKGNNTLTHLDLRNNKIGPECGPLFGEMLQSNHNITHLDLSWNDLGVEGGKALLKGIEGNHSLIDCQLSGNRITEDTLHAIAFILRRNRQAAPLSAMTYQEGKQATQGSFGMQTAPLSPGATMGPPQAQDRSLDVTAGDQQNATMPSAKTRLVQDEGLSLKLLQKERDYTNAEDARFFGEVAEYIDLLQLDVARNKKYRMDAEERERIVTKGFMEREMRYAQEMRELENLLAKAKAEKDELVQETQYLQNEIDRVREEKSKTMQDRLKLEELARATADRLRCDIRDGLAVKADLETQIYKVKRRQQEQEEENARLRTYLSKCKDDLDRALR
jgi:Ran GTPase-activating protein (RanGAP) involved in mRNA processing and transport